MTQTKQPPAKPGRFMVCESSEPYLYLVVLPPLILFALGFRRLVLMFSFGAAVFFTIRGVA